MTAFDSQQMLFAGTRLFLLGLLTGIAIPAMRNKRMGLSAHLVGVQHGIVLWVVGLIQTRLTPSPTLDTWMTWTLLLGLYGLWLAMLLAAIWGASRSLPMAGAGFEASRGRETVVTALVYAPSLFIVAGVVLLLIRLW